MNISRVGTITVFIMIMPTMHGCVVKRRRLAVLLHTLLGTSCDWAVTMHYCTCIPNYQCLSLCRGRSMADRGSALLYLHTALLLLMGGLLLLPVLCLLDLSCICHVWDLLLHWEQTFVGFCCRAQLL